MYKKNLINTICNLYKYGYTNSEIANELNIKLEQVKSYMKRNIRTRTDYRYINSLHKMYRKEKIKEKNLNKYIQKHAKMEIDNEVNKFMTSEQIVKRNPSAYRTDKNGILHYIYDESTRPIDLPKRFVPSK